MKKKKRKWQKKKHKEHSMAPRVQIPMMSSEWADEKIDANVHCPPTVYTDASAWLASNPVDEIAGFGVIQDGEIVWMCKTSSGKGGRVTSLEDEMYTALELALAEGHDTINLQWHTHPQLSAFWSMTDSNAQLRTINSAMTCSSDGHMHFLVMDWGNWLVRRVEWSNGVIKYNDAYVTIGSEAARLEGYRPQYYYGGIPYSGEAIQPQQWSLDDDAGDAAALVEAFDAGDIPRFRELAILTDHWVLGCLGREDVYKAAEEALWGKSVSDIWGERQLDGPAI